MSSIEEGSKKSVHAILPLMLIPNLRVKIQPEQIPAEELLLLDKKKQFRHEETQLVPYPEEPPPTPVPKYTLEMTWNPNNLYFILDEEPVTLRIRIWNTSYHAMYFFYCGLWGDRLRLGASWCCYPRTRFWLAPGLSAGMTVTATPRELAPIACADGCMQVAAGHMRDSVTGYFAIPITAKFLKYIPPPSHEGGE